MYYVYSSDGNISAQITFTDAAIWSTIDNCDVSTQDANHYSIGETVYINGDGFAAASYNWTIKGKPGGASCDPNLVVCGEELTLLGYELRDSDNTIRVSFCWPKEGRCNYDSISDPLILRASE